MENGLEKDDLHTAHHWKAEMHSTSPVKPPTIEEWGEHTKLHTEAESALKTAPMRPYALPAFNW